MLTNTYLESLRTPKQRAAVETFTTNAFPTIPKFIMANKDNQRLLVTHGTKAGTLQDADLVIFFVCRKDINQDVIHYWNRNGNITDNYHIIGAIHKDDVGTATDFDKDKHLLYSYGRRSGYFFCPDEIVLTYPDNRYLPIDDTCNLCDDYYDPELYYDRDECYWSDYYSEYILTEDAVECDVTGLDVHRDDSEVEQTSQGWVLTSHDDVVFADDTGEYLHIDDARWCDERNAYFTEEGYHNYRARNRINDYHCGVAPERYVVNSSEQLGQYTIGFEVEKNDIDGEQSGSIEQQPLFSHWERDSSCGVEGITHVYSLNNSKTFFEHLSCSDYVDEETDSRCGGHINVAHINNQLEMWHFKPWMGLMWALWRKRLKNSYSNRNKKVNPYAGRDHHYGALVEKGRSSNKRFEIRIPNRVHDSHCLKRRFQLMQHLMTCIDDYMHERFELITQTKFIDKYRGLPNSVSNEMSPTWHKIITTQTIDILKDCPMPTFRRVRYLVDACLPILQSMYQGNPNKLAEVILLAYLFQWYIDTPNENIPDNVFQKINQYIQD